MESRRPSLRPGFLAYLLEPGQQLAPEDLQACPQPSGQLVIGTIKGIENAKTLPPGCGILSPRICDRVEWTGHRPDICLAGRSAPTTNTIFALMTAGARTPLKSLLNADLMRAATAPCRVIAGLSIRWHDRNASVRANGKQEGSGDRLTPYFPVVLSKWRITVSDQGPMDRHCVKREVDRR